jgi:hypothetical protein
MSLTELISKEDASIGRWEGEAERSVEGAAGNLKQAEDRHSVLLQRREIRRQEMERQRSLLGVFALDTSFKKGCSLSDGLGKNPGPSESYLQDNSCREVVNAY